MKEETIITIKDLDEFVEQARLSFCIAYFEVFIAWPLYVLACSYWKKNCTQSCYLIERGLLKYSFQKFFKRPFGCSVICMVKKQNKYVITMKEDISMTRANTSCKQLTKALVLVISHFRQNFFLNCLFYLLFHWKYNFWK